MRKLYTRMFRTSVLSAMLLIGMAAMMATSLAVIAEGQTKPPPACGNACTLAGDCDNDNCYCTPLGGDGTCRDRTLLTVTAEDRAK